MTDFVATRLHGLARQFFAREDWVTPRGGPSEKEGLPALLSYPNDRVPFRADVGYLRLEVHYPHREGVKSGLYFHYELLANTTVGPLMQSEQELLEWARQEYPDRVVVVNDRWADIPSVMLQAFAMPGWRERHPDIAAEADSLKLLLEIGDWR